MFVSHVLMLRGRGAAKNNVVRLDATKQYSDIYVFYQQNYSSYIEIESLLKDTDDNGRPSEYIDKKSGVWAEIFSEINKGRNDKSNLLNIRSIELFENGKVYVDCGDVDSPNIGTGIYLIRGTSGWVEISRYSYVSG